MPDVPVLGRRVRFPIGLFGMPLHVTAEGLVANPDGSVIEALPGTPLPRTAYLDGEQLMGAMQGLVRRELRAAFTRAGIVQPEGDDAFPECGIVGCHEPMQGQAMLADTLPLALCAGHIQALAGGAEPEPEPVAQAASE